MVHETFACSIIVLSVSNESIILLLFTCVLHESNSYKDHHILNHFDNCCNCPGDFEFNIGYQVEHPVAQLILLYKGNCFIWNQSNKNGIDQRSRLNCIASNVLTILSNKFKYSFIQTSSNKCNVCFFPLMENSLAMNIYSCD